MFDDGRKCKVAAAPPDAQELLFSDVACWAGPDNADSLGMSTIASGLGATPDAAAVGQVKSDKMRLKSEDFINMMVTQLQNQDPLEPAKNDQLLAQMSQIGQLESSTALQEQLSKMVVQNNIGAAGNLIGKSVTGSFPDGTTTDGTVTAVRVEDGNVVLELDNGAAIQMDDVISIRETLPYVTPADLAAGDAAS
jgi:flagellar basal-body rod modification protein FlgD